MADYDSDQLKRFEPAYLSQYGLNKAPFSTQHDDTFLYLDVERRQHLETLAHLTQYSNLLLIITGERGIGKTSLLQRFYNTADDSWYICEVNAHTMMDADSMLTDIARGFGLNGLPNDPSHVQEIVFEHLKALQNDNIVPILIIDDAHELPKEALETLFYFADIEAVQGHLLRIILFCEPQIDIMLESPSILPLRERITHTLELNPLNENQTAEFIKHRMAVSGFEGTSPFSPKVIQKIHKIARGIPLHICELAHLHLDDAASLKSKSSAPDIVEPNPFDQHNEFSAEDLGYDNEPNTNYNEAAFSTQHIVFVGIIVVVSIIVFAMQDTINEAVAPSTESMATINKNLPSAIVLKEEKIVTPSSEQNKQTKITLKAAPTMPELEDEPEKESIQPEHQVVSEKPTSSQEETIHYTLDTILPNPVIGSSKPQTITIHGNGFQSSATPPQVWISWTGKTKQLKKHQYKIIDDNNIALNITVGTSADKWSTQLKQNNVESNNISFSVVKPKARPTNITALTGIHDERWVLKQEPKHFTLQLVGSQDKKGITKFTKANKLSGEIAVYQTLRKGKVWYSLIYGSYNSKGAAQQAKKEISNKTVKPWLRQFESVQAKINTHTNTSNKIVKRKGEINKNKSITTAITSPSIGKVKDPAAWLWSQDPRHYTLQLLGGRNDKSIQQFIQKYKLRDKAIYYQTKLNKRNWYALVYGSYSDRRGALEAIKQLPKALQKTSPWARSFASIHKDLDQSQ